MNKHTPGPWKLLKFDDDEHYTVTNQEGTHGFHREIAKVSFGYSEPAETEQHANAALIAAAPDLLALLKEWDEPGACGCDTATCRETCLPARTRAAIAKATTHEVDEELEARCLGFLRSADEVNEC